VPTGPDATRLEYVARAQVGGKLAQVGSRLIDGAAQRMAEDFFERFVTAVAIAVAVAAIMLLWRALA
jgi:carbon monoxide dehydrogenase subunit G